MIFKGQKKKKKKPFEKCMDGPLKEVSFAIVPQHGL